VPLLVRSRGGRWIEKWEAMRRLENFRVKTIPPDHPLYDRMYQPGEDDLRRFREACDREANVLRLAVSRLTCMFLDRSYLCSRAGTGARESGLRLGPTKAPATVRATGAFS
jgi:hypothetical protein